MQSFELPHRRARVWRDEVPPAYFTASSTVTHVVRPKLVVHASRRIAGLELNISQGPRAQYGLLGAELVEANVDGLEVVVSVHSVGSPFQGSLAWKPDDVRVGLLEEYAPAVVAGVAKVAESSGVPTRRPRRFRWAAHALVGSSPWAFETVSGLVVRLLMLTKDASDEQMVALLGLRGVPDL